MSKFKFTEEAKDDLRIDLHTWDKQGLGFDWLVKAIEDNINSRIEQIVNERDGWIRVEDGIDYQAVFNKACAFYTEWAHGDSITELMASFAMNYAYQSCAAKDAEIAELKLRIECIETKFASAL